ncbi:MAG: hypothetical protein V4773_09145 [Verrucomicrobiota bacterium]
MTKDDIVPFLKKNPLPVVCVLITLVIGGLLYWRAGDIPELEEEIARKLAEADKYALNIKYSSELKEHLEAVAAANKAIDARLTRASQQGTNTQYFYKLERDTGVKLTGFSQSANVAKPAKAFTAVAFSVSVQGTLPQVLNFLRQIESGTHYARVLAANFNANPSARNSPISLSLTIETLGLP